MPILPPGATAADRARAADAVEQRAEAMERSLALVALRLFAAEADAIDTALASAETDAAVQRALAAIVDAYRAPAGLFRRAWAEALGAIARAQYLPEADRVRRDTARVTGRPVPPMTAAQRAELLAAADARAAQAAAEITATSADRIDVLAQTVAPLSPAVLREIEAMRATLTVPPVVADVTATPVAVAGAAPLPRPAVIQARIDTLAPLVGRQAAEQIVDRVAETLAKGQPTRAVVRDVLRDVTATTMSRKRAELIARTEQTGLLNSAEADAVRAAGILKHKRWITSRDDRVRASHVRCAQDGIIPIDALHSNGLPFPGYRPSPARETARCRCSEGWLP